MTHAHLIPFLYEIDQKGRQQKSHPQHGNQQAAVINGE